ncbi:MAG: SDR family NAD(P)-dependent oxidoreductase [Xenococcaceae cyanobacterium MO_167.B52]|nr:SDR family NAD(P)-dependent oxidoreductase [Xenococcaceae cyanobacterium MO_167.B52]
MRTIKGKTVLLTGASRGLGLLIARVLAQEGATIVGVARSSKGLEQFCSLLNGNAIAIPFDLSRVEELPILVQEVKHLAGSVDILINNAGIEKYRAFTEYSLADLQAVLSINLVAAMELTRLILPEMLRRDSGHIVNMASLAAKKGSPYNSIYSASKGGLLMWTDTVRQELVGTGVGISAICPGYVLHVGMSADTGVPISRLAGASQPWVVAKAVAKAIQHNQAERIINQDFITEGFTKLLFMIAQFSPRWVDAVYQLMGIGKLNQRRIQAQTKAAKFANPKNDCTKN